MSAKQLPVDVEANLRELRAMTDEQIDLSDIPEVTDFTGFRRAAWNDMALLDKAVPLEPDLLRWFVTHGSVADNLPTRVNRALREYVARAQQEAA